MSSCERLPLENQTLPRECAEHVDDSTGLEDAYEELGALGRYQILQLFCLFWCYISYIFVDLGFVFTGYEPEHTCLAVNETSLLEIYNLLNDSTATVSYDTCSITVTSNRSGQEDNIASLGCIGGYSYRGGKYVSMVTEWDLVCDKIGKVELVQSMLFLGNAFGMVTWTSVADRFGRKYTYMFNTIAAAFMELGLLLSQNVAMAITFRLLSGFFVSGMALIAYVTAQELFVSRYRHAFGTCESIWWCMTITILSGCAFILRNNEWRHLQLLTLCTFAPSLMLSFLVDETPAWYFAKGQYEDAKRILMKACAMNKKNIQKLQQLYGKCVENEDRKKDVLMSQKRTSKGANYSLLDFLHHKRLFITILVLVLCWMTLSFGRYGLFLTSSTLAGDRYLNFFLLSIIDVPACIIFGALHIYIGRRTASMVCYGISAIAFLVSSCLVGLGLDDLNSFGVSTAISLLGKFAMTVCFITLYLYTFELHPTAMRSTALGVCECFAMTANIFSPYLLVLSKIAAWGPGAINATLCLVCAILVMLLPETKGRQMASTIEDVLGW